MTETMTGHNLNPNMEPMPDPSEETGDGEESVLAGDIRLTDFIADFGKGLMAAVAKQNPPVFNDNPDPAWTALMKGLKRVPFEAQQERVQAVCKLLLEENASAAVINADMGTGKSMMGIAAAAVMHKHGYSRTLIICPPHLVYKWRREILVTVEDAKVWVLNGPDTLRQLLKIRATQHQAQTQPEFYVLGRVRMRMGFDWQPAATPKRQHMSCAMPDDGVAGKVRYETSVIASCPHCGTPVVDDEQNAMRYSHFIKLTDKRRQCPQCHSQLWSLVRPKVSKNHDELVYQAMCKIPTIGPKTAGKLLKGFGAEVLGGMLDDNVFDFINLMDENGDLVFSDRQAKRMETALAKQEFGFGQGGYQPSEFIKRYLPAGFFDLLIADEAHEYKNSGSAQGQAMGVLASKARKTILLTGTLMGGYGDDIFHLLWRIMPERMMEDGFRYSAGNSLGPAALAFMREHGILKEVYKETQDGNHRTAKGKRMEVHTSKAPGFGPKGVVRYILPFTVFLKLNQIGGNILPSYDEDFINVAMADEQKAVYDRMSDTLTRELKEALRKKDKTLLGVVLSALLAWPDTCFREWDICHPRTRHRLFYAMPAIPEDQPSQKEAELIALCQANKAEGRKVLVYTVYTGKHDTSTRLKALLESVGFKVAVLRSTVSTESREDWILDQVDRGIDILICNPELVKTGLDLLDFPTICFMQTGYSVYTVQQAARRSWRIGQQQAVRVHFLGYEQTAQISCLQLMAKKIAVSQSTSGDMPDTGLDVLNSDGDSIEVALAKQLLGKPVSQPKPVNAVKPAKPASQSLTERIKESSAHFKNSGRYDSEQFRSELSQFHGTEQWYRHMLVRNMLYTDGVQFFAEHGGMHGAYWFLDIVATEYWPLLKTQPFHHIVLEVSLEETATISVDNGNNKVLKTRQIEYTDMQPGQWKFYLTDNVLLLPGEY